MDEVQTGFGRLGTHYWGCEYHGVTPDIITTAKSECGILLAPKHVPSWIEALTFIFIRTKIIIFVI